MNVGKLRELLKGVPDDALIVIENGDHNFRKAYAEFSEVVFKNWFVSSKGVLCYQNICEYYETVELQKTDKIVKALIVC